MSTQQNIVIVGASASGHALASKLQASLGAHPARILLIDPSPVAYWPPASLRASVVPGWEKKVYKQLSKEAVFGKEESRHELVRAKVERVKEGSVVLDREWEGSTEVSFVALALATGASQVFPMRPRREATPAQVEADFRKLQEDVAESQRILVVGGGPTGIEFAGEVLAQHPDKQITLIHGNAHLLDSRFPPKLARVLEQLLRDKGVDLRLGQHWDAQEAEGLEWGRQEGARTFRTREGEEVQGDFVFVAKGNEPNTAIMREVDPEALTPGGLIKVNEHLQVESKAFPSGNVFALGDCADSPGWRTLVVAEADTATVASNIALLVNRASTSAAPSLKKHKPGMKVLVVPLGPGGGSGFMNVPLLGDVTMPGFMVTAIKAKSLFVDKFEQRFAVA